MSFSRFMQLKKCSVFFSEYFVNSNFNRCNYYYTNITQLAKCNTYFRYYQTNTGNMILNTENVTSDPDTDLHEFNNAYQLVCKALLHTNDKAIIDALNWNIKVLDYNVQGGKKIRGVTVLKSFKILAEDKVSSDTIALASLLGWCVEMLQGFFVMCDDIMDHSIIRRGKPCWYKLPDVGMIAINDALLLECGIYRILEMYFKNSEAYNNLLQEFLQVTRKTIFGQTLDMLNVPPNKRPNFEDFNIEKYKAVVEYKTSHYTFCLPVHLAMHLVGTFSEKDFESTKNICLKLGLLYQIQDDYIDVYGDPDITGKVGTDINDGKCTWLAVSALEDAPKSMKTIMLENYGVNNEDSVSKVKELYNKLHLEEKFYECEQALMNEIALMINSLSGKSLQRLLNSLLQKIYKRKK